jgi:hypothetical protein
VICAQAVVEGARERGFRSKPIVDHVHSRVGGQRHRCGQRKIAFWRRTTDVAAAVEVKDRAIGATDLWLQGDRGDTPYLADVA